MLLCGPLWVFCGSFVVLCGPLWVLCGPLWSFAVLCGPLRYLVIPVQYCPTMSFSVPICTQTMYFVSKLIICAYGRSYQSSGVKKYVDFEKAFVYLSV